MSDQEKETESRDWDRHDWAGEEHPSDEQRAKRWNDKEWAGEPAPEGATPAAEHEAGPSGGGHTPGEQHWAPDKK